MWCPAGATSSNAITLSPVCPLCRLQRGRSPGGYVPHRLLTSKRSDTIRLCCHLLILLSRKMFTPHAMRGLTLPVTVCRPTEPFHIYPNPQTGGNTVERVC